MTAPRGTPHLLRTSPFQGPILCLRSLSIFLAGLTVGAFVAHSVVRIDPSAPAKSPPPLPSPLDLFLARPLPPPGPLPITARPAGIPGGVALRGRRLPPEADGCAALRRRFLFYNRPPKTGSTSLRSALRAVARRCGLVELPCHRHAAPNTVGLVGALQLAGCGSVMACHVADRPGVRAAVDRAAAACPGGGLRLTSVRGLAGRDAAWVLQMRNAYANDTAAVADADIRSALASNAGDSLAAYFGLLPQPPGAVAGVGGAGWGWGLGGGGGGGSSGTGGGTGGAGDDSGGAAAGGVAGVGGRWEAPPLSREAIADHLLWYDALIDLTDDAGGDASRLLSAVLGVRVPAVAKENARTHGAFVARVGRLRNESRPAGEGTAVGSKGNGGGGLFPDEILYTVAREMYRHQVWFTAKGGTFDELADAFVD